MKLFTPGPTEIHPDILQAMATPMINHRGEAFRELLRRVRSKARELLQARSGRVFFLTSSSTGCMEAATRCLVNRGALHATQGYFSENWHRLSAGNEVPSEAIAVPWGGAIHADRIDERLKTGRFDALAFVHCETSTGVMNRLGDVADVMKGHPEVLFMVDAVSTLGGVDIRPEALGIDVLFAGVQKCLGCPPGFTLVWVSDRALQKAARRRGRGYYFDLVRYREFDDRDETTETPSISHLFALDASLGRLLAEGRDRRFARHADMANHVRSWALTRGFELFPEAGFESPTVTCIANTLHLDVFKLNEELMRRGYLISEGLGSIRGKAFRIAHMGEMTLADIADVLRQIDDVVGSYDRPSVGRLP